ncbi:MAG: hypothetical protein FWE66_00865 [Oscillospiraceae bacterium]|nr:hypothetical protein [Oscillospiraceae bacterium]
MAENEALKLLQYKGRPLRRSGNELYYGNLGDSHIVFMQILSTDEVNGKETVGKVHVQLLSNNSALPPKARIIKESDKNGLYNAMDIGSIWLERALAE